MSALGSHSGKNILFIDDKLAYSSINLTTHLGLPFENLCYKVFSFTRAQLFCFSKNAHSASIVCICFNRPMVWCPGDLYCKKQVFVKLFNIIHLTHNPFLDSLNTIRKLRDCYVSKGVIKSRKRGICYFKWMILCSVCLLVSCHLPYRGRIYLDVWPGMCVSMVGHYKP